LFLFVFNGYNVSFIGRVELARDKLADLRIAIKWLKETGRDFQL